MTNRRIDTKMKGIKGEFLKHKTFHTQAHFDEDQCPINRTKNST